MPAPAPHRRLLAAAVLAAAAGCGAAQEAAAGAAACSIQTVFAGLSEIKADVACRAGCNSESGDCPADWTPGADDICSAACGHVFEPFWDSCGEMLTNAHMGGMEDMGLFYDSCLERLYPPGTCGTFCNTHTFECYLAEVQESCCDEGGANCVSGEDVPETCPVGCAIVGKQTCLVPPTCYHHGPALTCPGFAGFAAQVFPQFLEVCREHLEGTGAVVADFDAFSEQCLRLDGVELVECALHLAPALPVC